MSETGGRGGQATPRTSTPIDAAPDLGDFRDAVEQDDLQRAGEIAELLPEHQLREALDDLTPTETEALLRAIGDEQMAELLEHLEPADAADILRRLPDADAADVVEELDPDDAADVVGAINSASPDEAQAILVEMEPEEAGDVRSLMAHSPNTAGGRMTPEYFAVSSEVTADEAIQGLRAVTEGAEFQSYVYVIDAADRLLGVVPLYRLVLSQPHTRIADFMVASPISVRVTDDQEDVARIFRDRRFLAVPVVDGEDRLVGVVTADDIADVLEAENTEDVQRLGGSEPLDQPYLRTRPLTLARKRIGWLLLLFVAETYTGTVLRHFEDELQQVVALAFFIPLLIGTGGNAGSQTVVTVIRAMAVGEVELRDIFRVWRKEVTTAFILASILVVASFGRAWLLGVNEGIAITVAIATSLIVLWASTVAALLPLLLRRLRVDPAVVSAPLITTLVDGTGLMIYFETARRVLGL